MPMTFGKQLELERDRLNLTQAETAKKLGVPPRTYWQHEAGRVVPSMPYQEGALARLKRLQPQVK